jgi:hypothetical protein
MTIANLFKVTTFPFVIKDRNGNIIYYEDSTGYWEKSEYDSRGNEIYRENSTGYWEKREWDTNGKMIYKETSTGVFFDKRPKVVEMTLQEIADKMGIKVEQLRIKD